MKVLSISHSHRALVATGLAAVMAVSLLPGAAFAATGALLINGSATTPQTATLVAGQPMTFKPTVASVADATVLTNTAFTIKNAVNITLGGTTYAAGSAVPFASCASDVCTASVAWTSDVTPGTAATYTITATDATDAAAPVVVTLTVTPAAASTLKVTGLVAGTLGSGGNPVGAFTEPTCTVTAYDTYLNVATGYAGTVVFSSSDAAAAFTPGSLTFVAGTGIVTCGVTFHTAGTQSVTVYDVAHNSITGSQTGIVISGASAATVQSAYVPMTPVRVLDSRYGTGRLGRFSANVPASFQVSGVAGIPAENAGNIVAVTGILTVATPSAGWAVALGPNSTSTGTSMINFVKGQTTSNGVTVALSSTGVLWATYISSAGNTTDIVFDVTGYFTTDTWQCNGNYCASAYHALPPYRAIDTRSNIGTVTAAPAVAVPAGTTSSLVANQPMCFDLTDQWQSTNFPVNTQGIQAVVGNVTITGATFGWAVNLGPVANATPSTSSINFLGGQTVANGVTVALSNGNTMCATFISRAGNTANLVFDVTGYYVNVNQDQGGGLYFTPLAPSRLVDTRKTTGTALSGVLTANMPRVFQVASSASPAVVTVVPSTALAVSGNVTITDQTAGWAAYVGPDPLVSPTTSTINFVKGQVIANGVTIPLGGVNSNSLYPTFISTTGNTTNMVFDVTGYFSPWIVRVG